MDSQSFDEYVCGVYLRIKNNTFLKKRKGKGKRKKYSTLVRFGISYV